LLRKANYVPARRLIIDSTRILCVSRQFRIALSGNALLSGIYCVRAAENVNFQLAQTPILR
jgi:hypothetical protein